MTDIITIPQMRLAQLQSLAEKTLEIAGPLREVAIPLSRVRSVFATFKEGMLKDKSASDKKTLDDVRDRLISGFMLDVKAEARFPHRDTTLTEVLHSLYQVVDKYGFEITRLPYDEQSARVDNMLAEVGEINLRSFSHLFRWIALIRTANQKFKAASSDYLKEVVTSSQVDSATQVAPELLSTLEGLYTMLFAHAQVTRSEPLIRAHQELTALVDSYR